MSYREEVIVASAARTATGNSGVLSFRGGDKTGLRAQLDVTAASGTSPTLDVTVQDTLDGTNWNTIMTFTQATATTRELKTLTTPFSDRLRVLWTIAGTTPSFTFSVAMSGK